MANGYEPKLETFLTALDAVLDGRYTAVLHGSAGRGAWVAGVSDLNVLLLTDDLGPAVLRALAKPFEAWRRQGEPPPLLVTREEWAAAADVFPIELTEMLHGGYRVLRGTDPVAGVRVSRRELRRALEAEFRGKLLQLRRGYVALSGDAAALGHLAQASAGALLVLFRALLALHGRPAPADPAAVVREAAALARFDAAAAAAIAAQRHDRNWRTTREQFEQYLAAVEQAVRHVDQLTIGDDA